MAKVTSDVQRDFEMGLALLSIISSIQKLFHLVKRKPY